jgi:putative membrane protein
MIKNIVYTLLGNSIALYLVDLFLDGLNIEGGFLGYLLAALIIGVLNLIVKPIISFFSFPLVFFSAGLFLVVINAFLVFLTQYLLTVIDVTTVAMKVDGLLTYVFAAIIFGIANSFIHWLIKD